MAKPNFFCGIEALQALLSMELDGFEPDIELTMDLIEAPYLFIYTTGEDAWNMKVFMRGELYDHEKGSGVEKGSLRVERGSGQGTGQCSDKMLSDNMGAFFHGCQQISRYIRKENLQRLYEGLDPEQAGILLELSGGELRARKVEGKDRPEMMCSTLFGGNVMCRPYMEDFFDRSETEMMSLEDRIEKAENGDMFAIAKLAQAYLNGDDEVEQDPEKAAYWYRKEAEQEDSEGAFNLGLLYAKGFGVERDFAKAAEWMEKAVEWGDEDGRAAAELYRSMAENQKKAEAGDAEAMAELAGNYMALGGSLDQAGPGDDYKQSLYWAKKAADAGVAAAYWPLALAYEHGRGVKKDTNKAVEFYRKGAELGHASCQHSLACYYARGDFLKQDKKKAFELFRKAAAQGNGLAMKDLGRCYQFGDGCMGNMKTALEWYTKASEVLDDPELDARVAAFRGLAEVDPSWGEDYPGTDDWEEDAPTKAEPEKPAPERKEEREKREREEYNGLFREWQQKCDAVRADREERLSAWKETRRGELKSRAENKCRDAVAKLESRKEEAEKDRKEKEAKLGTLGVFQFGEKKALKEAIAALDREQENILKKIGEAEETLQNELAEIGNKLDEEGKKEQERLERECPLPPEPKKPDFILEEERLAAEEKAKAERIAQKDRRDAIPNAMKRNTPYTAEEIGDMFGESADWARPKLNALASAGVLSKIVDKRVSYYFLN